MIEQKGLENKEYPVYEGEGGGITYNKNFKIKVFFFFFFLLTEENMTHYYLNCL